MPDRPRAAVRRKLPGRTPARGLLGGAMLAAGISALALGPAAARAADCAEAVSVDAALQRLNALRQLGAVCRAAGERLMAPPLRWNDRLAGAAAIQAAEMATLQRMVHHDAAGRGLVARLVAVGYGFRSADENIAVGQESLEMVLDDWLASEAHCLTLMNPAVVEVGLACRDAPGERGAPGPRYWTLVVGTPARPR
jgi:uncharacterized protein YkwD